MTNRTREKAEAVWASLTARVIEAMEADPGHWTQPWSDALSSGLPVNAKTGAHYRGGNVMWFVSEAIAHGYPTNVWATYKQWSELGHQVAKGSKGAVGVYWHRWEKRDKDTDEVIQRGMSPRVFTVFNAAQLTEENPYVVEEPVEAPEPIEVAEAFFSAVGATVVHDGAGAWYRPASDVIGMPAIEQFRDAESYYSTLAHEHAHWTGHESRLNRDLANRFGSEAYAMEELVAELSAVFTTAHLGLASEPRPDHAQYLAHWVQVLREDPGHLWLVSNRASAATEHLVELAESKVAVAA